MGVIRAIPINEVHTVPQNYRRVYLEQQEYRFCVFSLMSWSDIPGDDEPDPPCVCVYRDETKNTVLVFENDILSKYGIKE